MIEETKEEVIIDSYNEVPTENVANDVEMIIDTSTAKKTLGRRKNSSWIDKCYQNHLKGKNSKNNKQPVLDETTNLIQ